MTGQSLVMKDTEVHSENRHWRLSHIPINTHSGQNQPDKFGEIFQQKEYLGKYL